MSADAVITGFLGRVQARGVAGFGQRLAPDVAVEWPASGERFRGREAVVAVNREYPEGWSIDVVRVVPAPDRETVVSEVEVPHQGVGVFAVTSWWRVRAG